MFTSSEVSKNEFENVGNLSSQIWQKKRSSLVERILYSELDNVVHRCIKQSRYFRTAIITSYIVSGWTKLLKVGRILWLNMYICCVRRFRVKNQIRELYSISYSFIEMEIYIFSSCKFLCNFCSSFCFKFNPIWRSWKRYFFWDYNYILEKVTLLTI